MILEGPAWVPGIAIVMGVIGVTSESPDAVQVTWRLGGGIVLPCGGEVVGGASCMQASPTRVLARSRQTTNH